MGSSYDTKYLKDKIEDKIHGKRFIIVSYRGPFETKIIEDGEKVKLEPTLGGVSRSLEHIVKNYDSIWISKGNKLLSEMSRKDGFMKVTHNGRGYKLRFIDLTRNEIVNFYRGFSNETLWPLSHGFLEKTIHKKEFWRGGSRGA